MKRVPKETKKGTWKYVWKLEKEDWYALSTLLFLVDLLLCIACCSFGGCE